ncbi:MULTISPECIES: dephospho-CoA kinase [unclassified Leucobacter]|uniref:dephospho-CoA kinase n=1 Tax=unclassified Leucobacter TaxID=2621730 RepID=UPI003017B6D8
MTVIALTGGIASGKSTIGRRLAELGAVRIDADELAREAVAPGSPGLTRVVQRFGSDMIGANGELDRAALGAVVFSDPAALAELNAIVHPEVRRIAADRIAAAEAANPDAVVVYEIPLLVETGSARDGDWDLVLVADAPAEQRIERMVELRGMAAAEARARIAHQASDSERLAVADAVIDTSRSEAETLAQVDALWAELRGR